MTGGKAVYQLFETAVFGLVESERIYKAKKFIRVDYSRSEVSS